MTPLELRYEIYKPLIGLNAPASIKWVGLLSPGTDGAVRMRVATTDPMGAERTYTITIKED